MREARVISAVVGSEWAMSSDALKGILAITRREASPSAVEARLGRPLENTHAVEMRGGVAVIPVVGPLFRRANMFTRVSGATSYEVVAQDLRAAVEDPSVKAILLNIDSPGGMANGVAELASHVFDARGAKTVVAYVGGLGASAAYWLAAAAGRIVVNKSAMVGSIGTVVSVGKGGDDDEEEEIVSSQSPYKRTDVTTEDGRARVQALVDNLAAIFITDVAKFRGVSEEHVLSNFGKGDLLIGQAAADAKMVDSLGTFEGLVAELNATNRPVRHEVITMNKEQLKAEYPEVVKEIEAEVAAKIDVETEKAVATLAERERVLGIIGHVEAKGREALAMKLAGMPNMTLAEAAGIMAATSRETDVGREFEAAMKRHNPEVEASIGASDEDTENRAYLARMRGYAEQP